MIAASKPRRPRPSSEKITSINNDPAALADAHAAGRLALFGEIEDLRRRAAFDAYLAPLKRKKWFVYARPPFAGPEAVLAYLAR